MSSYTYFQLKFYTNKKNNSKQRIAYILLFSEPLIFFFKIVKLSNLKRKKFQITKGHVNTNTCRVYIKKKRRK